MKSVRSVYALRTAVVTAMLLVLAAVLAACGGSSQSSGSASSSGQAARSSESASSESEAVQSSGSASSESEAGRAASGGGGAAVAESEDGERGDPGGDAGDFDHKIVKTADLGLRAQDVRKTATEAQRLASRFGGSVLSSRIERGGDSVSADLVLLVPSPEFEPALDELRDFGEEVTTDSVEGEDVTEEFVDLQSRERNLLAAEDSLLGLYDEAESVEDSLSVQSELTEVRGEIEQVQGRIEYLEQRTASSRIFLHIEPAVGSSSVSSDWEPAGTVAQAWNASLGVLQTLATAAISVVVFSWWLAPTIVVALVGFVWWRRRNRGSGPGATGSPQP